jgi:fructose-1,6-bisphosphatase/inositol monophosphatase family enzyme
MANECKPLFRPGDEVTVLTTGAVTGSTFVDVSATRDATTGLVKVATASAGARAFGVASYDIASGAKGSVQREGLVFVFARAAITAGAEVEVGGTGGVITLASGKSVGKALETGSNGNLVLVALSL